MRGRVQKIAKRLRLAKTCISMLKSRIRALRRQLVNIKSVAMDILKYDSDKAADNESVLEEKDQLDEDSDGVGSGGAGWPSILPDHIFSFSISSHVSSVPMSPLSPVSSAVD